MQSEILCTHCSQALLPLHSYSPTGNRYRPQDSPGQLECHSSFCSILFFHYHSLLATGNLGDDVGKVLLGPLEIVTLQCPTQQQFLVSFYLPFM